MIGATPCLPNWIERTNYCLTWNEGMLRHLKRSKYMYGFQHCFVSTVVPDVLEDTVYQQ